MPSLFVVRGNDQGVRFELTEPVTCLGRDTSNSLQLHDTEVSRRHAELRREGSSYALVDLTSSNGTYVNGSRIQQHILASGDEVIIGGTQLLYTASGDESHDHAERIDIVTQRQAEEQSRIVRTMTQEEGSRLFGADPGSLAARMNRAGRNFQLMYRTALAVSHTLDIDELLNRIMQLLFDWVEADRGCIMLMDPETKLLSPKVRLNRKPGRREDRMAISKTILDYVIEHNEGVVTSDASEDQRWDAAASIVQTGIREAICAPMQGRYGVVGVIYVDTLTRSHDVLVQGPVNRFNDDDLKMVIAIANQAALAVEDTQYYSAMVQAERLAAMGQTIAMLSHHIKNILQGIRGGSFLIKEGLAQHNETTVRRGWEFVEKNQQRISNLVLDMLTFSKEREPDLAPADLNRVVHDVIELMADRAQQCGVALEHVDFPDMPTLVFDAEAIHRAVLNVVTNAIDACQQSVDPDDTNEEPTAVTPRVSVHIEYDEAEQVVRVVVADNGPGIPPDEMKRIFTLFVSDKGHRGTGLGLPVSQKILQEHGGGITVESTVGEGSRFVLELPAATPNSVGQTASLEGPPT